MGHYEGILEEYGKWSRLDQVSNILMWDQNTYMPPGGIELRGDQLAIISGYSHEIMTSKRMSNHLKGVKKEEIEEPERRAVVREIERLHERASSIPRDLITEMSKMEAIATDRWLKAKEKGDFGIFSDVLEKIFDLKLKMAEMIGYEKRPYDALLDEYEPYMRTRRVESIFNELGSKLSPLVDRLCSVCSELDTQAVRKSYPTETQAVFVEKILKKMGYDLTRGRIDMTAHPFTSGSMDDVRVTVRYEEEDIRPGLFAAIHEGGHALYEQGFLKKNYNTPLAESVSLGIHESQSRMWENMIGRSREFWSAHYPLLRDHFPSMKRVSSGEFHRAINHVEPSLIRVEADEVTYSMHILIRFEIELAITDGRMEIDEIPQVWNEKYDDYLGVQPSDAGEGCLQDIHWGMGAIGYFPTYTLGNLYSAQFYRQADKDIEGLRDRIAAGDLGPLLEWLRTNIHSRGKLLKAEELVKEVTDQPLDVDNFIGYLKEKYSDTYGIHL